MSEIEYTEGYVEGNTRHDIGGYPKSFSVGDIIDIREYNYDGSESIAAYVFVSDVIQTTKYLAHKGPKREIPCNRRRPHLPKYAQWYRLDHKKMESDGVLEKRYYFETYE